MNDEILTSENSPELKAEIERLSELLLEQNRKAYEELAKFDTAPVERHSDVSRAN